MSKFIEVQDGDEKRLLNVDHIISVAVGALGTVVATIDGEYVDSESSMRSVKGYLRRAGVID